MSTYDNPYSRFVAWVKIILPLVALGLLSSMFLLARDIDPTRQLPFAQTDVTTLAREQSISAPNYAGVTSDGSAISISATQARPDLDDRDIVRTTDMRVAVEGTDGSLVRLSSQFGTIDTGEAQAVLQGGVIITTSTGYRVTTEVMTTRLDRTDLSSGGDVRVDGPAGELTAGRMHLTRSEIDPDAHVLVFKDGVELIYDPNL
ncbi:LPS export ABC transporter periplasmic protein LptC [Actibacterium sp. 188UL27-1]|uniref:LPS export ABC transporter periplasmic protein LptC n=1 Tax=Actibacterium sp. 188UL27-1 TaxID=2786961 RepID=UPI00195727DA|nr:LPS export ABC transporter periplasmic protein LptC [Actibacterium sp. 188UL27-1]MBM7067135.1 LPS export ABC transporter periplasmic protein LptC [Actibacterium sp. 188UL27-1]